MPYFQVVVETMVGSSPTHPEMVASSRHVIVNKHPFATLEEVMTAAVHDTHYPNAAIYAVEAPTPQEAAAVYKQAGPSKLKLIRKGLGGP
jgi:hypothetical protein